MTTESNSYDEVPYLSEPFPLSRSSYLFVLSQIFGNNSAAPDRASVLELGCGSGNNIIPQAYLNPDSNYVGVDSSESQIALGLELISELGLKNIKLLHVSIEKFTSEQIFDYIICHGMYSWVKESTQETILNIFNKSLAKNGLAYISYNTLPGWHLRNIVRDAMLFHTRATTDPKKKILEGRAYLNFLAFGINEIAGPYSEIIKSTAAEIDALPDWYVFHDFLEDTNQPIYFSDFMKRAESHNLAYICDADITLLVPQEFPPEVQLTLRKTSRDNIYCEQTTDFLRNQLFRRSIVCHKDLKLSRDPQTTPIKNFYISSPIQALPDQDGVKVFKDPLSGYTVQTKDLEFARVLQAVGNAWPMSVSYKELLEKCSISDEESLCLLLLRGFISGTLFFDSLAPRFTNKLGALPEVWPVARALEKRGANVVNLRHENISLDELGRKIVALADGTRSIAQIQEVISTDVQTIFAGLSEHCLLMPR